MNVAKLWEAMDTEAEERLLKHGLDPQGIDTENSREPALHIRRTLDQSYFLNLDDTTRRDRDQVVYRATRLPWHVPGNLTRVVMVDQLWMWILDDCKLIPSCISSKLTDKYRYYHHCISKALGTEQTRFVWNSQKPPRQAEPNGWRSYFRLASW